MKKAVLPGIGIKIVLCIILLSSCTNEGDQRKSDPSKAIISEAIEVPQFSSDSAYKFIEKQVAFGPRVPNTPQHVACGDYLISTLKKFADTVVVQKVSVKAFDNTDLKLRNIIASWNPQSARRILLCAHWDTRPFADQDEDRPADPILGANDGGSGTAVLLEMARHFSMQNPDFGIDIILFDGEDYGQPERSPFPRQENTYCLGSQYWAANPHQKNYYAEFGILLDMVGAKDAKFTMEGTSMYYASSFVKKVWQVAYKIGHGAFFPFTETKSIVDDHLYINSIANIPVIDIIQYDAGTPSNFGSYWHTHDDNMDIIDKNTLNAVGETLMYVVYNYKRGI